jgi:hypothetical protein
VWVHGRPHGRMNGRMDCAWTGIQMDCADIQTDEWMHSAPTRLQLPDDQPEAMGILPCPECTSVC